MTGHPSFDEVQAQLRLPHLPTPRECIDQLLDALVSRHGLVPGSKQRFVDLGAGEGGVVARVATRCTIASIGIEINASLVKQARISCKRQGARKARMTRGDLYTARLEAYDFIYIFAFPDIQRFLPHVLRTAREGAIVIAYKHPMDRLEGTLLRARETLDAGAPGGDHRFFIYERASTP